VAQLKPGRSSDGRWLEYDEPAARDAEQKTRAFLAEHLVSVPATPQPSHR
jgi:dienelactone hydrolase